MTMGRRPRRPLDLEVSNDRRQVPSHGSGDLRLAGRAFVVETRTKWGDQMGRQLGNHFGLVVATARQEPLLVMRFADFLRQCRFRDPVEGDGPKTSPEVSATPVGSKRDRMTGGNQDSAHAADLCAPEGAS